MRALVIFFVLILGLSTTASLQPKSVASGIYTENGNWSADNIRGRFHLRSDEVIQGWYNTLFGYNIWFCSPFFVDCVDVPKPDDRRTFDAVGSWTIPSHDGNISGVIPIWNNEKHSTFCGTSKDCNLQGDELVNVYHAVISYRIFNYFSTEEIAKGLSDFIFDVRDDIIKTIFGVQCISNNIPDVKIAASVLHEPCLHPDDIIGDMNFTNSADISPLFCTNLGVCGDHREIRRPVYNDRGGRSAATERQDQVDDKDRRAVMHLGYGAIWRCQYPVKSGDVRLDMASPAISEV